MVMVVLFIVADYMNGFSMLEKLYATGQSLVTEKKGCSLEKIETNDDGVSISCNGYSATVAFGDVMDQEHIRLTLDDGTDLSGKVDKNTGEVKYKGLENVSVAAVEVEDEPMLQLTLDEKTFLFAYDADAGYMIYAGNGYYEKMENIDAVDFGGLEHLASGRLYIWSRTLPLLKKYFLLGCGEDNFYLVYPQNDYLGKAWYCETPYTVIEKPHNTFILIAVQQGIPALVLFLGAVYFCIRNSCKKKCVLLVLSAFLVAFLFNDSSIVISPLFWCVLGVGFGNQVLFSHGQS
jgi:hypothetical protein